MFYEHSNCSYGVRKILTRDWLSRKKKHWNLIPLSHSINYITLTQLKPLEELFQINIDAYNFESAEHEQSMFVKIITAKFTLLELIMKKYPNNIAVCGGILARVLCKGKIYDNNTDVDIFFYGCSEAKASNILEDCLKIMGKKVSCTIEKRTNVINFYDHENRSLYQFILRIYPTLDSIIGGFDLGPSMLCMIYNPSAETNIHLYPCENYNQFEIYGTELGIWSIAKKTIIVDTTRRSTSFSHRLIKYNELGYNIVFPGLTKDYFKNKTKNKSNDYLVMTKLKQFLVDNAVDIITDLDHMKLHEYAIQRINRFKICDLYIDHHDTYNSDSSISKARNIINPNDLIISQKQLQQYSDYSSCCVHSEFNEVNHFQIIGALLRCNNKSGVFISHKFENGIKTKDDIDFFNKLIYEPKLDYEEELDIYSHNILSYLINDLKSEQYDIYSRNRSIVRKQIILFGEYNTEFRELICAIQKECVKRLYEAKYLDRIREHCSPVMIKYIDHDIVIKTYQEMSKEFLDKMTKIMTTRMITNAKEWQKDLIGFNWITENPSRQWTSSINPIMEDPRMFYLEHYCPFRIGMKPEIEVTLRLLQKRNTLFNKNSLCKDLFDMILSKLALLSY